MEIENTHLTLQAELAKLSLMHQVRASCVPENMDQIMRQAMSAIISWTSKQSQLPR